MSQSYSREDIEALLDCVERMRRLAKIKADELEVELQRGSTTLAYGQRQRICKEIREVDVVVESYIE